MKRLALCAWFLLVAGARASEISVGMLTEPFQIGGVGVILRPQVSAVSEVRAWSIDILDWKGREIHHFEDIGPLPKELAWLGADARGGLAESGFYKARLSVDTKAGEARVETLFSYLKPKELGQIQHVSLFYEDADRIAIQLPEFVFAPATAKLTAQAQFFLMNLSSFLKQRAASEALVLAYTDASGQGLSQQRAHAVFTDLVHSRGVKKLRFRGLAEDLHFAQASKAFAKRRNNRIEIWLAKTGSSLDVRSARQSPARSMDLAYIHKP